MKKILLILIALGLTSNIQSIPPSEWCGNQWRSLAAQLSWYISETQAVIAEKAFGSAIRQYGFVEASGLTRLMGAELALGFMFGLSISEETEDKTQAIRVLQLLAVCKISEHILLHDTGFLQDLCEVTPYGHVMTCTAALLGYSLGVSIGCAVRKAMQKIDDTVDYVQSYS